MAAQTFSPIKARIETLDGSLVHASVQFAGYDGVFQAFGDASSYPGAQVAPGVVKVDSWEGWHLDESEPRRMILSSPDPEIQPLVVLRTGGCNCGALMRYRP